jgi:sterol desaturase/sphingolipid hydroxylase (fatty acid hydroxylase superfamily)
MIRYTNECLAVANGHWLTDQPERPKPRSQHGKSIRIFESPVLEAISRAHPITPGLWFGPFILVAWIVSPAKLGVVTTAGLFAAGVLFFSFFEYSLHRFVFHGLIRLAARDARYRFVAFMAHGYHHEFPNDRSRLVMPPMISWPLALAFAVVFWAAFGATRGLPLLGGAMTGYIAYDWVHYYTHHFRPRWRLGKWMRAYHLRHHFQDHDAYFGISSPLWDVVFGTFRSPLPVRRREIEE